MTTSPDLQPPTQPEPTAPTEPAARVRQVAITEELKFSYLDYAMSVIVGRALPDVRDGLKPVHLRIFMRCSRAAQHLISRTANRHASWVT